MTRPRANLILDHLRRLTARQPEDVSDRELLCRYITHHDEEAFARLMGRHRPMVQGVALCVLGNWHDSEDVVQAVFIVLARKAAALRGRESAAA
jgi:DNA-directed RNA polymerase specialized sigma24 family protein